VYYKTYKKWFLIKKPPEIREAFLLVMSSYHTFMTNVVVMIHRLSVTMAVISSAYGLMTNNYLALNRAMYYYYLATWRRSSDTYTYSYLCTCCLESTG
jgi:hypothetical protein